MSRTSLPSSRVTSLDGLRGIAAFIVIVSHIAAGFFPALYFGAEGRLDVPFLDAMANSPLFVLYSGTFAVYVFFVLSGFVIAASTARTTCRLSLLVFTRYLRLTIPILASVCGAFVLANIFPGAPQRAAQIVGHWWLGFMYQPPGMSFGAVLREAFFNIYLTGLSYHNNVLWTMRVELAGSLAIYAVYLSFGRARRVPALALLAMLLCLATRWSPDIRIHLGALHLAPRFDSQKWAWTTNILGFCLGALIYEARSRGRLPQSELAGGGLVLAGLFLGGLPFAPADGTIYAALSAFVEQYSPAFSTVRAVGAAALILGIFMWKRSRGILNAPLPQFLGRISFSLYLVHFPLLCFGLSELYLLFGKSGPMSMMLAVGVYLAVTIASALGFTVLIDEPTVRVLARLKKAWSVRPPESDPAVDPIAGLVVCQAAGSDVVMPPGESS
jgi:peptidoglycan/LPS O-acetylase OafA/YrhL